MALNPYFLSDTFSPSGALDQLLTSFLQPIPTHSSLLTSSLAIDFVDNTDSYVMKVDVPGFKTDDISITNNNRTLTISCIKNDAQVKKDNYYYSERRQSGTFARSIRLPKDADSSQDIEASLDAGVLTITIPKIVQKVEESKEKKITIKSST